MILVDLDIHSNLIWLDSDMLFVKTLTRPEFWGQDFTQKRVKRNNGKFVTKQRESFKMPKTTHQIYTLCVKIYTVCVKFTQYV